MSPLPEPTLPTPAPIEKVLELFHAAAAEAARIDPYFGGCAIVFHWKAGLEGLPFGTTYGLASAEALIGAARQTTRLLDNLAKRIDKMVEYADQVMADTAKRIAEQTQPTPATGGPSTE